jgi:hypothetical protein
MRASGYDRVAADWYCEPAWVVDALFAAERVTGTIWDPACGCGTIPKAAIRASLEAVGTDIADRGYGLTGVDFFGEKSLRAPVIVSNPPYKELREFVYHGLSLDAQSVIVIARLAFLASVSRRVWFQCTPLARIWVCSRRPSMPPGGTDIAAKGGSIDYAWFVWDRAHFGDPVIRWLP